MSRSQFALFFNLLVGAAISSIKPGDTTTLKQDTIDCLDTVFNEEFAAGLQKSNEDYTMDNSRVFIEHYKERTHQGYVVRLGWGDHGLAEKSLKSRSVEGGSMAPRADDPPCLQEAGERTCAATLLQNFIPAASLPDWTSIGKSWNQLKVAMKAASNIGTDCKVDKSKSPPATAKPHKVIVMDCIGKQANAAISKSIAEKGIVFSAESELIVDSTPARREKTRNYQLKLKEFDGRTATFVNLFKGSSNPSIPAIPFAYADDRTICEEPATMRCANQMLEQFSKLLIANRFGITKTWKKLIELIENDNTFVCK